MPADDPVHRGDVPPPIDLAGHLRELGRAFVPALIIAALVGAAVFGYRNFVVPKQYSATIVTEIQPAQEIVPGDAFIEQLRAPFMGLSTDTDVLNQVLSEVPVDTDASGLASMVTLEPGTSPALLTFTVTADSPQLAADLVRSMVDTVGQASAANFARNSQSTVDQAQAAVAAEEARLVGLDADDPTRQNVEDQLGSLRAQLAQLQTAGGDQLVILSVPELSTTPVSPKPVSEALVAFLAALVVAAELIVLTRGRRGSKPNRAWARRVARKQRATFDPASGGALPPLVAARIATLDRGTPAPTRSSRHAKSADTAPILLLLGDGTSLDVRPGAGVVTAPLSSEWWKSSDVSGVDTAVVLVSTRANDRAVATATLRQLRQFGITTHLVLQTGDHSAPATGGPQNAAPAPQQPQHNGFAPHDDRRPYNGRPYDQRPYSAPRHLSPTPDAGGWTHDETGPQYVPRPSEPRYPAPSSGGQHYGTPGNGHSRHRGSVNATDNVSNGKYNYGYGDSRSPGGGHSAN